MKPSAPRRRPHLRLLLGGSLLASAIAAACVSPGSGAPRVDDHELAVWREYLVPHGEETAWLEVPWIPELAEGVRVAGERGRPILLWVMNGHPLGCT